jgi:DNA-binding MarR family transcriptional regulator
VTVLKAGSRLSQELERALKDADLTLPQFNVLMELAASPDGALPSHAVTERLISTPSSLSWLTTRMRDLGLLTKERDQDDARVVVLAITEAGWDALETAMRRAIERRELRVYYQPIVSVDSAEIVGFDQSGKRAALPEGFDEPGRAHDWQRVGLDLGHDIRPYGTTLEAS